MSSHYDAQSFRTSVPKMTNIIAGNVQLGNIYGIHRDNLIQYNIDSRESTVIPVPDPAAITSLISDPLTGVLFIVCNNQICYLIPGQECTQLEPIHMVFGIPIPIVDVMVISMSTNGGHIAVCFFTDGSYWVHTIDVTNPYNFINAGSHQLHQESITALALNHNGRKILAACNNTSYDFMEINFDSGEQRFIPLYPDADQPLVKSFFCHGDHIHWVYAENLLYHYTIVSPGEDRVEDHHSMEMESWVCDIQRVHGDQLLVKLEGGMFEIMRLDSPRSGIKTFTCYKMNVTFIVPGEEQFWIVAPYEGKLRAYKADQDESTPERKRGRKRRRANKTEEGGEGRSERKRGNRGYRNNNAKLEEGEQAPVLKRKKRRNERDGTMFESSKCAIIVSGGIAKIHSMSSPDGEPVTDYCVSKTAMAAVVHDEIVVCDSQRDLIRVSAPEGAIKIVIVNNRIVCIGKSQCVVYDMTLKGVASHSVEISKVKDYVVGDNVFYILFDSYSVFGAHVYSSKTITIPFSATKIVEFKISDVKTDLSLKYDVKKPVRCLIRYNEYGFFHSNDWMNSAAQLAVIGQQSVADNIIPSAKPIVAHGKKAVTEYKSIFDKQKAGIKNLLERLVAKDEKQVNELIWAMEHLLINMDACYERCKANINENVLVELLKCKKSWKYPEEITYDTIRVLEKMQGEINALCGDVNPRAVRTHFLRRLEMMYLRNPSLLIANEAHMQRIDAAIATNNKYFTFWKEFKIETHICAALGACLALKDRLIGVVAMMKEGSDVLSDARDIARESMRIQSTINNVFVHFATNSIRIEANGILDRQLALVSFKKASYTAEMMLNKFNLKVDCDVDVECAALYSNALLLGLHDEKVMQKDAQRDTYLKCFCVSDLHRDRSLNSLRNELNVLLRHEDSFISVERLVFVVDGNTPTVSYIVLELEYASFDLIMYIEHFCTPFNLEQRHTIARRLITAMWTLHSMNIIWRDVAPQNVLIFCEEDGTITDVKLCDFSSVLIEGDTNTRHNLAQISASFNCVAPEAKAGQFSFESDVFALGSVLMYTYGCSVSRNMPVDEVLLINGSPINTLRRVRAQLPQLRPKLEELVNDGSFTTERISNRFPLIKKHVKHHVDYVKESIEHFSRRQETVNMNDFRTAFPFVFSNRETFFNTEALTIDSQHGVIFYLNGVSMSKFEIFADEVFKLRLLHDYILLNGNLNPNATDDDLRAVANLLYLCIEHDVHLIPDYLPPWIIIALSDDYNSVNDPTLFKKAFYVQHSQMISNYLTGCAEWNEKVVDATTFPEYELFFIEETIETYAHAMRIIHETFRTGPAVAQLNNLSFEEIFALLISDKNLDVLYITSQLDYGNNVDSTQRLTLERAISELDSVERTKLVYWMSGLSQLRNYKVCTRPAHSHVSISPSLRQITLPQNGEVLSDLKRGIADVYGMQHKMALAHALSELQTGDIDSINNRIVKLSHVRICPFCFTQHECDDGLIKCKTCSLLFCPRCLKLQCRQLKHCNVAPVQTLSQTMIQKTLDVLLQS
ncbi:hypothetical protein PCE1_001565 [Barthelona sp. PCE]